MRAHLLILALLLAATSITALGITPARIILEEQGEFAFTPLLTPGEQGSIAVTIEGDLKEHITLTEQSHERIAGIVNTTQNLAPGDHQQRIILSFIPDTASGTIAASMQVAGSLIVRIPYDGPFLQADLDASTDKGSGTVLFTLSLENLGNEQLIIDELTLTLADGDKRETILIEAPVIAERGAARLDHTYTLFRDGERTPGIYTATLTAAYEGKTIARERELTLGLPKLTLTDIIASPEAGTILPIDVSGEVVWNVPLLVRLRIYVDNATTPALEEELTANGLFTQRLYLEATQNPHSLRATLEAQDARAERTVILTPLQEVRQPTTPWLRILLIVTALLLIAAAILLLREKNPET